MGEKQPDPLAEFDTLEPGWFASDYVRHVTAANVQLARLFETTLHEVQELDARLRETNDKLDNFVKVLESAFKSAD